MVGRDNLATVRQPNLEQVLLGVGDWVASKRDDDSITVKRIYLPSVEVPYLHLPVGGVDKGVSIYATSPPREELLTERLVLPGSGIEVGLRVEVVPRLVERRGEDVLDSDDLRLLLFKVAVVVDFFIGSIGEYVEV